MFGDEGLGVINERVLLAIYDRSGGSCSTPVDLGEIQFETQLSDNFMRNAINGLMSLGCIRWQTITIGGQAGPVVITDKGAAKARDIGEPVSDVRVPRPRSGERREVPTTVINVAGNMINSAIQAGSPGASQHVMLPKSGISDNAVRRLNSFLDRHRTYARQLRTEIGAPFAADVAAQVATIRAQLGSSDPVTEVIEACVNSIRKTLENAADEVVTAGLLAKLAQVHF